MKTSVLISNYNYAEFLPSAIHSVLSQSVPAHEIIVVDDGSTDNSREIIERYGDQIIPVFQENSGQAAAISNGYARATGDIIMLLDADDLFHPHKIEILESLYQQSPDINWIFHDLKEVAAERVKLESTEISKDVSPDLIDQRDIMTSGHLKYDAPATSGLSFRREFMCDFFPMPRADGINLSDHYIKFYCLATSSGYHISEPLGLLVLHGGNLYSGQKSKKVIATRARIFANTAIYLEKIAPHTKNFCNNLMGEALYCGRKAKVYKEIKKIAAGYLSDLTLLERLKIRVKIFVKSILFKSRNCRNNNNL